MSSNIFEKVIKFELSYYLALDDTSLEKCLKDINFKSKERIKTINDLEIVIYSNDHNPPHFHVISSDLKINAKFSIENCELISGTVNAKQRKRIYAFFISAKGKILMESIWNKRLIYK